MLPNRKLMTESEVMFEVGMVRERAPARSTFLRWVDEGRVPQPIHLFEGKRQRKYWRRDDVVAWLEEQTRKLKMDLGEEHHRLMDAVERWLRFQTDFFAKGNAALKAEFPSLMTPAELMEWFPDDKDIVENAEWQAGLRSAYTRADGTEVVITVVKR